MKIISSSVKILQVRLLTMVLMDNIGVHKWQSTLQSVYTKSIN